MAEYALFIHSDSHEENNVKNPPRSIARTLGVGALLISAPGLAATGSVSGAVITQLQTFRSSNSGASGSFYVTLDTRFTLAGGCLYGGNIDAPANWILQFDAEHASFKAIYATALSAHAAAKLVQVFYDDGFGPGTSCRITGLVVEN